MPKWGHILEQVPMTKPDMPTVTQDRINSSYPAPGSGQAPIQSWPELYHTTPWAGMELNGELVQLSSQYDWYCLMLVWIFAHFRNL